MFDFWALIIELKYAIFLVHITFKNSNTNPIEFVIEPFHYFDQYDEELLITPSLLF